MSLNFTFKQIAFIASVLIIFFTTSCSSNTFSVRGGIYSEISDILQSMPAAESFPDADILYLLNEEIHEVFTDGNSTKTVHNIFMVVSESGKDYANQEISYDSRKEKIKILYARTINADGKSIHLKGNAINTVTPYSSFPSYSDYKELTFSMPGVTIGSVIDIKYVMEMKSEIQGEFDGFFFFQRCNPVLISRYMIIAPEKMNVKYRMFNPLEDAPLSPDILLKSGKIAYLWEYKDIPQIFPEDNMPPFEGVAFNILVTSIDSWELFFQWWKERSSGKATPDEGIKEKVAELTSNLPTLNQKAEAIFDYVRSEIRYVSLDMGKSGYVPECAQKVFGNKYGDCKDQSTLLISMLRVAGIPAYYVFVPTQEIKNLVKDFPYPFQFNHCIVAIESEGGYQFLDPTAENYRFGYLPGCDQNRGIVIFKENETIFGITPLAKAEENFSSSIWNVEIGLDGSLEVVRTKYCSGSQDAGLRSFLIYYSPTEIKDAIEIFISDISPGAELLAYSHSDPLNFKKNCMLTMNYQIKEYCKKAGDILIFHGPVIEEGFSSAGKEERRYPIQFESKSQSTYEVEFNIPEGYRLYYLPEPVEIRNAYFDCLSTFLEKGTRIIHQVKFIKKTVQVPIENYVDFHESCQKVEKTFDWYVLFKKIL